MTPTRPILLVAITACICCLPWLETLADPPGTVIDHIPASTGRYVGSPSIAELPDGTLVASHDEFGPKSNEHKCATTRVFRSTDRGETWKRIASIEGQFWSQLFWHRDNLYLIGTWAHHGNLIIRRSSDQGATWTSPDDAATGLLAEGEYHCSPQPLVVHEGRIWRAIEDAGGGSRWGERYRPFVMSAPLDADLLDRESWTFSNYLPVNKEWLQGDMRGWLEGNLVVAPNGKLVNMLRVAGGNSVVGKAAMVTVSDDGTRVAFDPETGFVDLPGGSKKFTIRFDAETNRYWSLVNEVPTELAGTRSASSIRNRLALVSSPDLKEWTTEQLVIDDDDLTHGYQYVDWIFDGDDLLAVVRTATDDGQGGAHNYHDANYLTLHRIKDFRKPQPPR
ncbi:sialidase family protein [Aeoliella mucimassa]|uniref:BNR/Asp-box repeat protein n=1 Tax=Aeoliella mucimassa TaxID=2527972 RepID=A0A518AQ75_9BACT|nr:sialidase family protein [Aeoliella mucimassa]QDU56868.1 hypothetical protein Pan181_30800 [Aeoliella mucimassa]